MYTLPYGVEPIIKHIKRFVERQDKDVIKVWCTFDLPNSEFVKQISNIDGVEVINSHLLTGQDFYSFEPDFDIIISNPPFKGTTKLYERLISFGKPFAMIFNMAKLNDKNPLNIFKLNGRKPQLIIFDNRMVFRNGLTGEINTKIPFKSGYLCCDFLEEDIILETLPSMREVKKIYDSNAKNI